MMTQETVTRQCDEALKLLQGIADDLGFAEARALFISQCAAFALVNLYQHRNRLAPQRA